VQQNNQPTFFSPRAGVTKVVVNQSVDSVGPQKVAEMFIWLLSIFSILCFLWKGTVSEIQENV
jgi:hypothetical protein